LKINDFATTSFQRRCWEKNTVFKTALKSSIYGSSYIVGYAAAGITNFLGIKIK
jgi:hypothetical protein